MGGGTFAGAGRELCLKGWEGRCEYEEEPGMCGPKLEEVRPEGSHWQH